MATVTKNISLPPDVVERLQHLTREEMPSLSALVTKLLTRELDEIDAARARRQKKGRQA